MNSCKRYHYYSIFSSLIFIVSSFSLFTAGDFTPLHNVDILFVYGLDDFSYTPVNISQIEAQLIFLNLERINSQIDLTAQNLKDNNTEGAFYHSYIPHSVTYPTIKQLLEKVDPSASIKLEGLLTDLPIIIKSNIKNPI